MKKSNGRLRCEALKAIRKKVAEAFGISYTPRTCTFEGECSGICPMCQSETDQLWHSVQSFCQEHSEQGKALQQQLIENFAAEVHAKSVSE